MSEITTQHSHLSGFHKVKKRSTRVDLTPMVDLGFLLLTFFVFTSGMSGSKVLDLKQTNDINGPEDAVCTSCTLTLLAGKDNSLYYYEGFPDHAVYKKTSYSPGGVRDLIVQKKKKVFAVRGQDELILIIKAGNKASFKNLIDLLDESNITMVKKYYMDELTGNETAFLEAHH